MKKFLILLCAVFGLTTTASAISPELQIGYGGYTQMDACDMHNDYGKVKNAWGALTVGLNFRVAPKFDAGVSYTFSSSSFKHTDTNLYYHVIMVNGRYEYWRNSIVKLYGHLGVGVDITHFGFDADNKAYFAFQLSPVGAEVGISRNFAMYGELGFGAQGLLQVGVRLRL